MKHYTQLSLRNELEQSINPSQAEFDRLIKLNTANTPLNKSSDFDINRHISASTTRRHVSAADYETQISRINQHNFESNYLEGKK